MAIRLSRVFLLLYYLLILGKTHKPTNLQLLKQLHIWEEKARNKTEHSISLIICCHLEICVFSARSGDCMECSR